MHSNLHIVERRGRKEPLVPGRQLDISTLLEALPDAALVCNSASRIVDGNSALETLSGIGREKLRGLSMDDLARHLWISEDTEVVDPEKLPSARALKGETVKNQGYVLRRPKEEPLQQVIVSASPIRGQQAEIIGSLLMIRDVTEITELRRNIDRAERQRAVGQMATGVAHDFNNVLDTIGQAVAVLDMKADAPAEERRQFFGIIRGAVQQGAEIVSRVRDYVSFRAGHWTSVDIAKLVEECVELTRPLWHPARVQMLYDWTNVPLVWANVSDLRRMFTNLIINALEAMPQGGRMIVRCYEENGNIRVSVTDTGSGIAAEHRKNIFRPYFTTKPEGTGIGLSGAQTIVRAHGGDIHFNSQVGLGTTFWVTLPVMKPRSQPHHH